MEPSPNDAATGRLLSVTELAHRVGVSVRTLQYYDQLGVLSPTAKGPGNQRLYAETDCERLYRILVLKYLGYPLREIRDGMGPEDAADAKPHISAALDKLEPEFMELFKRMTTLRKLELSATDGADWTALARIVESGQEKGPLYWQAMSIRDGEEAESGIGNLGREEMVSLHSLFSTAAHLMLDGIPTDDPRVRELARRFEALGGTSRVNENLDLMMTSLGSHRAVDDEPLSPVIGEIIAYLEGTTAG